MDESKIELEYSQILEELVKAQKESNDLMRGFYETKKEKVDITKAFSVLNFPSKGVYYPHKKKSVLIRYLTAIEEHVLTDSFLMESGRGIELVLNNLIVDDLDIGKLLTGDFQALLIFLRSTSYGDKVEISPTCPHCGKKAENDFYLSSLDFKENNLLPDEAGKYYVEIPEIKLTFELSPMTLEKELEKNSLEGDENFFTFKDSEGVMKIKKSKTLSLLYYIDSVNGISDKIIIKKFLKTIPKMYTDRLLDFIKDNESGVQDSIILTCPFCGEEFRQMTDMGYSFISLPYEYKETILEEIFLITYYGKGITRQDAMGMPVYERKWHIRRIKEELDKKAQAEKRSYASAKSKKGKF